MAEEFDIAVSYSRKNGPYVRRVVKALERAGFSVYFDVDREAETIGTYLSEELQARYGKAKRCCLVFTSKNYLSKWTKLELRSARERAMEEDGYLIEVRLDNTKVEGMLPDMAWLDARNRSPERTAEVIIKKYFNVDPPPRTPVERVRDYVRFRRWWAVTAVALSIVLAALFVYLNRPSRTLVSFHSATPDTLVVQVENSGARPSRFVAGRLKFDGVPLKDANLRMLSSESNKLAPGRSRRTLFPVDTALSRTASIEKTAVLEKLGNAVVTLEIDVQESNAAEPRSLPPERMPNDKIRRFVNRWVSDEY